MKEIIYVQAGSFSNYVATHFWNTQETYLSSEQGGEPFVDHEISFVERLTGAAIGDAIESVLFPRVLVFDCKSNFGALSQQNALKMIAGNNGHEQESLWNGNVVSAEQDPIPRSRYHEQLDADEDREDLCAQESDIRFWSDYSHVYYLPKSLQRVPDAQLESSEGVWNAGAELFKRFDHDAALLEGSLRSFVEECDSLRGLQVMNDTETFGSFVNAFLEAVRDEFSKLPALVLPVISDSTSTIAIFENARKLRKAINDGLFLKNLHELSSLSVPVQPPLTWNSKAWDNHLEVNLQSAYQTSAILSAGVESATLPLRLKNGGHQDIVDFSSQLNGHGSTRFARLSSAFPMTDDIGSDTEFFDFSLSRLEKPFALERREETWFARHDVLRGFSPSGLHRYYEWSSTGAVREPFLSSVYARAIQLPTSFPPFFKPVYAPTRSPKRGLLAPPAVTCMISSLTSGSQTATLFATYAKIISDCVKHPVVVSAQFEEDDLRELANDLWTIHDNYVTDVDDDV